MEKGRGGREDRAMGRREEGLVSLLPLRLAPYSQSRSGQRTHLAFCCYPHLIIDPRDVEAPKDGLCSRGRPFTKADYGTDYSPAYPAVLTALMGKQLTMTLIE